MAPLWKLLLLVMLVGCNQVFYQPDHEEYADPSLFGLLYHEYFIGPPGEEVHLWVVAAKKEPRLGTVLQFHGNAQNMSAHFYATHWLPKYGYDLVCFDYRGYGKSSGSASRDHSIEDGLRVLKWMAVQPRYREQPVFVLGQSLGGAVAIASLAALAEESPAQLKIAGLILDSSFASYRSITQRKLASLWLTWPLQVPLSYLVSDSASPRDFAEKIRVPVLMFHSREDPVVPFAEGEELFSRLGSKNKQMVEVEKPGHTRALGDYLSKWRKMMLAFMKKYRV
jgi:alpha-beta hydrolase superfamily lysophospholipase